MRAVRAVHGACAFALAVVSWVVAHRITAAALGHRHTLGDGGSTVAHQHGSALLLAGLSLLLACMAGVLVVALSSSARSRPALERLTPGPEGAIGGAVATAPLGVRAGRAGTVLAGLAVADAAWQAHRAGVTDLHPQLLLLVGAVQGAVAYAAYGAWRWCLRLARDWGSRLRPATPVLPAPATAAPDARRQTRSWAETTVRHGRGPPSGRVLPLPPAGQFLPTG